MRIAFLMTQSLDSPSGLGRYGPISRELARLGHDIEMYCLHYSWSDVTHKPFTDGGVRVRYVGQMHVSKTGPRKSYYGPVRLLAISLASTARLARALFDSGADLIQLCKAQPFNVLAARLGGRRRPIYCDCDDYEAETNRFSGQWQRSIVRYSEDGIINHVRAISSNTLFTCNRYATLGFQRDRLVYVPNGVERHRFGMPPDRKQLAEVYRTLTTLDRNAPLIAYVGTLGLASHPIDLLLQAFQLVIDKVPEAQLLLAGGGEDYDSLVDLSHELGISERTIFAGRVPPSEVPAFIALASVSVDPVNDDLVARARSPLKVVESLTLGVPVVTSDVGDRRALLGDGKFGLLVNPGDSSALADGLLRLIGDEQLRHEMGQAAFKAREQWFWDSLVQGFTEVYNW